MFQPEELVSAFTEPNAGWGSVGANVYLWYLLGWDDETAAPLFHNGGHTKNRSRQCQQQVVMRHQERGRTMKGRGTLKAAGTARADPTTSLWSNRASGIPKAVLNEIGMRSASKGKSGTGSSRRPRLGSAEKALLARQWACIMSRPHARGGKNTEQNVKKRLINGRKRVKMSACGPHLDSEPSVWWDANTTRNLYTWAGRTLKSLKL